MLSNSDPTNSDPDDDFFDKLYEGYRIERVNAIRAINSKGNGRGTIRELLILNNKWYLKYQKVLFIFIAGILRKI